MEEAYLDQLRADILKLHAQLERVVVGQAHLHSAVDGIRGDLATLPSKVAGVGFHHAGVGAGVGEGAPPREPCSPAKYQPANPVQGQRTALAAATLSSGSLEEVRAASEWPPGPARHRTQMPLAAIGDAPVPLEAEARTGAAAGAQIVLSEPLHRTSSGNGQPSLAARHFGSGGSIAKASSDDSRPSGQSQSFTVTHRGGQQRWLPLHPSSRFRMAFDMLTLVILLIDSVMVPYAIAWNTPAEGLTLVASWLLLGFWSLDIVLNFTTGTVVGSRLVMDCRGICIYYVRTWFILDCVAVCCDALALVTSEAVDDGGSRAAALRMVRVAKVGRLVRIAAKLKAGCMRRSDQIIVKIAGIRMVQHVVFMKTFWKMAFLILWMNHLGACLWYAVGQLSHNSDSSWLAFHSEGNATLVYLMGFYWSVCSMFSGASFLTPTSINEAAFSAIYIVLTSLFLTSLSSSLAAMLVKAFMQRQRQAEELRAVSRFLQQHEVDALLSLSVYEQVLERMAAPQRLNEKDVPALNMLSADLRSSLEYSICAPYLLQHQFLKTLDAVDGGLLTELCATAVKRAPGAPGLRFFSAEDHLEHAYVAVWGALEYMDPLGGVVRVTPGQWVSEVALWLHWQAMGSLASTAHAELLAFSADGLRKAVAHRPASLRFARSYSAALCRLVKDEPQRRGLSEVGGGVDADMVVAAMPKALRRELSMPVLESLQQSGLAGLFHKRLKGAAELEREVFAGKCHLVRDPADRLLRVVHLVTLQVARPDGAICVELGRWKGDSCVPVLELPGKKVREGEAPHETVGRISEAIGLALTRLELHDRAVSVEIRKSESYGVDTKYVKLVYRGGVAGAIECQPVVGHPRAVAGGISATWEPFVLRPLSNEGDAEKPSIYAWMPSDEFAHLDSAGNEARGNVAAWLQQFTAEGVEQLRMDRVAPPSRDTT